MNSPSETGAATAADAMNMFRVPEASVEPFEFRMLADEDAGEMLRSVLTPARDGVGDMQAGVRAANSVRGERSPRIHYDAAMLSNAVEAARKAAFEEGEREGRRSMRAELDAQMSMQSARERERVTAVLEQFRIAREGYFAQVEQEVVKLALAIAARVLHREAQLDPLLLAGVVRVALEKMADRSGVVLRVAGPDVEAWERALLAMQPHERPQVLQHSEMERGECILETTMGTVELGVQVQLEEIEKGFFDLLSHRPTE